MARQEKSEKGERPPQHQERQPGRTSEMKPRPSEERPAYRACGKLAGKVALITGGDSGIGAATALLFAREGAHVSIVYLSEHKDAEDVKRRVEQADRRCLTIAGDVGDEEFCRRAVEDTVRELGGLDILVNNSAEQHVQDSIEGISREQLERTFRTNIFSMFFLTKAALKHLKPGSAVINTASITAYQGSPRLLDYSSTKGAIVAFTRSLAGSLVERGIRVNAVAPGPIWTPLIPSSYPAEEVSEFGKAAPMKRAGQPDEVATCYVFLASDDASYMTGQVLHPNGGYVING